MIEIRPARRDDADSIARAHVDAWRAAYRNSFTAEYLDADEFEASRVDRWRSWSWDSLVGSQLFVPVLNGHVVGFGHAGPERDEPTCDASGSEIAVPTAPTRGEVYGFYVHPDSWGSGAAAPLMAACVAHLREAGFAEAVLWVLLDNPRARGFYEKVGWSPAGVVGEFDGVPELQYSISLATT